MWQKAWRVALGGALLGALLSTWLAPKMIAWYFTPPVEFGINCKPPIEWALHRMQLTQCLGVACGFFIFLSVYLAFAKRRQSSQTSQGIPT